MGGLEYRVSVCRKRAADHERLLQSAGSQNSSWMLSGSRNTITDPIGVSVIGVKSDAA
jgi:hypothetical protein